MHQHLQLGLLLVVALWGCAAAYAQERESWATDTWYEVSGEIVEVRSGPDSALVVKSGGERWTLRLGEPWRNRRAGLDDGVLKIGQRVTVYGQRAEDKQQLSVKASRVVVDGRNYDLYPGKIR